MKEGGLYDANSEISPRDRYTTIWWYTSILNFFFFTKTINYLRRKPFELASDALLDTYQNILGEEANLIILLSKETNQHL